MKRVSEQSVDYYVSDSGNVIVPNTFQHHNFYVDELMCLLTPEEYKVLTLAVRAIMGWNQGRMTRKARIARSVFVEGFENERGQRVSYGTGLSATTVKSCLESLCKFKVLIEYDTTNDGTEYELNIHKNLIDMVGLYHRREESEEKSKRRAEKGVRAMLASPKRQEYLNKVRRGGESSDNTLGVSCDNTPGESSDNTIKQINQEKEHGENQKTIFAPSHGILKEAQSSVNLDKGDYGTQSYVESCSQSKDSPSLQEPDIKEHQYVPLDEDGDFENVPPPKRKRLFGPRTPLARYMAENVHYLNGNWSGFRDASERDAWEKMESIYPPQVVRDKIDWAAGIPLGKKVIVQRVISSVENWASGQKTPQQREQEKLAREDAYKRYAMSL